MTELEKELTELNKKQAHEIELLKEQIQFLMKRYLAHQVKKRLGAVLLRISKKAKKTGTSRRLEPDFLI